MTKVAVLILFSTGMRPEEMLAQRVGTFVPAEEGEGADADRGGPARGKDERTTPSRTARCARSRLDRYTASVVEAWIEEKRRALDEMGPVLRSSGRRFWARQATPGATTRSRRWNAFVRKAGFAGTRPYASDTRSRPSTSPGREHQDGVGASGTPTRPTLDLYVGFIPATTRGLADRVSSAGSSRDS